MVVKGYTKHAKFIDKRHIGMCNDDTQGLLELVELFPVPVPSTSILLGMIR